MSEDRLYAVISGDIVGSRRFMEKGTALADAIRDNYEQCAEAFEAALSGLHPVDIFAGDAWQMIASSPPQALRIGLCMRTLIKSTEELPGIDTRVAIGIGTVDAIAEDRVSNGHGEAFVHSGTTLKRLEDRDRERLAACIPSVWCEQEEPLDVQAAFDTVMLLLDAVCTAMTARQALMVAQALRGRSQVEIAESLSVSQPSVSKTLSAANYSVIEHAACWWEAVFGDMTAQRSDVPESSATGQREESR